MMRRSRQLVLWFLLAIPFAAASAQLQLIPGLPMTGSGVVSGAFVRSSTQDGLTDLNLGLSGDINGYYHSQNFLQFQLSPYYNTAREFAQSEFAGGGKGVGAVVNIFAGSSIPLAISFHRDTTSEATYHVLGSPSGVGGSGTEQELSLNWTLKLQRLPTFQVYYLKNNGNFTVLGTDAHGDSHGSAYSITAQQSLLGFILVGGYAGNGLVQSLPALFTTNGSDRINTSQKDLRFGATRTLFRSTYFDLNATRSDWASNTTGRQQDRTFDSATASVTSRWNSKVSTSFHANYSSDLAGAIIEQLASGNSPTAQLVLGTPQTGGPALVPLTLNDKFTMLGYNEGISYEPGHGLRFQGSAQQAAGSNSNGSSTSTSRLNEQTNYARRLFGGTLNVGYGIGISHASFDTGNSQAVSSSQVLQTGSDVGHSGSVTYTHQAGTGWGYHGMFRYSQSDSAGSVLLATKSVGGEVGLKSKLFGWRLDGDVRVDKLTSAASSSNDTLQKGFQVRAARGPFSFSASQQFTSGLTILTPTGQRLVPPGGTLLLTNSLGDLITPSTGKALSVTGTYIPSQRLEFDGIWLKTSYEALLAAGTRTGSNEQLDLSVKYHFRLLDCRAGYRHYVQTFSDVMGGFNEHTVYFQVSRRFNLF